MKLGRILERLGLAGGFWRRAFQVPRNWSNAELRRFAGAFSGSAVNVSAWEDKDKQGQTYRSYFSGCSEYYITNYGTNQGVLQGAGNEYFLDLELPLDAQLKERFDVVFNHTCLEHIWDFRQAFGNLCLMSRNAVVLVVPWLQPVHADYGDYWRFSPSALARLFRDHGLTPLYVSWNESPGSSVYVFGIGAKDPGALLESCPELRGIVSPEGVASTEDLRQTPTDFAGKAAFSWRPSPGSVTRRL